ncbi:uncharacterized protein LOC134531641 [Bacillus rossius redtenbacheri]|uniref:uncharacterized protein LOC134531641 n=1 Tax=Bacillus rossius redtenbacheri TaxID=93214 RepID=UPI002FDECA56
MNILRTSVTIVVFLLTIFAVALCCSASHSLRDYAARKRQSSFGTNLTPDTKADGQKIDATPIQSGMPFNAIKSSTHSLTARRKRRTIDPPYLGKLNLSESRVVQHSLTIGNLTLVKWPMMANFDAQKYCQRDGGRLAVVRGRRDVETLRTLLALSSQELDRHIFEAYVTILRSVSRQHHNIHDYHGYDAILDGSAESSEPLADSCTTLRKEGLFNEVDCGWSLAFFCENHPASALRARPHL